MQVTDSEQSRRYSEATTCIIFTEKEDNRNPQYPYEKGEDFQHQETSFPTLLHCDIALDTVIIGLTLPPSEKKASLNMCSGTNYVLKMHRSILLVTAKTELQYLSLPIV